MKKLRIVLRIVSMVLFLIGAVPLSIAYLHYQVPMPQAASVSFPLLDKAENFPDKQVSPGTFKIELPLPDFLDKCSSGDIIPLASYRKLGNNMVAVEYWVSRKDGIFYHASKYAHVEWPSGVGIGEMTVQNGNLTLYPQRDREDLGLLIVIGACFIGLGIFMFNK